jgi:gamma-glutamylcyclotransferase (GGCT)/AIG2-like uncharacterized protein YtfP
VTLLFVYGTLKSGHHNNSYFMKGCKFIGAAVSREAAYSMIGQGIPYLRGGEQRVLGEVWEVEDEALRRIDDLEGHPHHYCREQREFICRGKDMTAWVYMATKDYEFGEKYQGSLISWPPDQLWRRSHS